MDMQTAYNTAKAHLLAQGKKAVDDDGCCAYRTRDGLKCAIGCLIPDAEYLPAMENKTIKSFPNFGLEVSSLAGLPSQFLDELQMVHDNGVVAHWPERLTRLALRYNLIP